MTAQARGLKPLLLWALLGLFLLRVLGQVYVGIYSPPELPAWKEWYSGLLPYPLLLPAQILLLMWMAIISYENTQGVGRFVVESETVRRRLRWIAAIYTGVMVVRYILVMILKPEMRWFHGTIPILFHFVLAGFIGSLAIRERQAERLCL